MAETLNMHDQLLQVKKLDKEDQLELLQKLALLIKKSAVTNTASVSLTSLSGLGSEIWKSTGDINNYIEQERQW